MQPVPPMRILDQVQAFQYVTMEKAPIYRAIVQLAKQMPRLAIAQSAQFNHVSPLDRAVLPDVTLHHLFLLDRVEADLAHVASMLTELAVDRGAQGE